MYMPVIIPCDSSNLIGTQAFQHWSSVGDFPDLVYWMGGTQYVCSSSYISMLQIGGQHKTIPSCRVVYMYLCIYHSNECLLECGLVPFSQ